MARQRGNSWQGSLKTPEKYYRYSFPTEALAEAWEKEARSAIKAGEPIPEPKMVERKEMTLQGFFEMYRYDIWPNRMVRNCEANQRACVRFMGGDTLIHHITTKTLTQAVAAMRKDGNAPGTINTRLSHIKVLLRYAGDLEMVDVQPKIPWAKKVKNERDRFLTEEEETKLLNLMRHWGMFEEATVIEALIDTGCRPSELITAESKGAPIKWEEVSKLAGGEAPNVIDPNTDKHVAVLHIKRTKTEKDRIVPLTDRARNAFLKSKQNGDPRPFGKMHSSDLSKAVRKAADHLGYHDVVLYTMRHTCASRLVQRGADLYRVMKWMGHTNIKTTQRYAKLVDTDILELGGLL